jgi:hypothetical protein
MATVDTFRFNLSGPTTQKRKRNSDQLDDGASPELKRRSTHALPIRLSPGRPSLSTRSASYSLFTSIYQQPPTPVDTSDEGSIDEQVNDDVWSSNKEDFQPQSDSSTSSTKAQCGDGDVDMDMSTPLSPPKIRRARSNDIVPPARDSGFLGATDMMVRERVPTPISSHFDSRVADLPNVPRHQFPPLRTNLSPMIEQESWINRDGLPSPVDDQDMEMSMDRDEEQVHISNGKYGFDGHYSPSGRARTARLHMGFLQDCEKCIRKVPGHSSHIIWS